MNPTPLVAAILASLVAACAAPGPMHESQELVASPSEPKVDDRPALAPTRDLAAPEKIISQLRIAGLRAAFPWHLSKFDGAWNSVLRAEFGDNEVSCLLESRVPDRLEIVELEAEMHRPGWREADVLRAFVKAAQMLCGEPGLMDAIQAQSSWTAGKWRLTRDSYASGGYGLTRRYR